MPQKRSQNSGSYVELCRGTLCAKMAMIKDKNGRDVTEAEDIKKGWEEYTEELHQKDLEVPDNPVWLLTLSQTAGE